MFLTIDAFEGYGSIAANCRQLLTKTTNQARSQKILLGSAFEEKVDLLIVQYSPGAVAEFIWCMLIAHIHEGLY